MKFWTFYGERWTAKTSHLSMTQEGAYLRLCTWCMLHERPLPANRRDVLRIARSTNVSQEKATDSVLAQFFSLQPDGYHQKTADEILEWWHNGGAARNAVHDGQTRARVAALRQRRAIYVKALQECGVKVPPDIGIQAIRELAAKNDVTLPDVTHRNGSNGTRYVNCNAVSIYPVINTVTPCGRNDVTALAPGGSDDPENEAQTPDLDRPGPLTRALKAMEKAGLEGVYPAHPTLSWLLDAGVTPQTFWAAAREAVLKAKGYAWALAMLKGRIEDQAKGSARPLNGHARDFLADAGQLVSPEGAERLRKRLLDPTLDPWELPPRSESEGDDPAESTT